MLPDQIAVNVESHRLKGLAVGKCYSEYIPTPSEVSRSCGTTATPTSSLMGSTTPATTPGLGNSRNSHRNPNHPGSPLSTSASSSSLSRTLTNLDQAMLKSSQAMHISQINSAYMQRQKTKYEEMDTVRSSNGYIQRPVLFSDSCEGEKAEALLCKSQSPENLRREYTPYQNVKHLYHMQDETNK